MNNTKSLKLGAAFAAALALTGCDKPLSPEAVQARMDQIFTELDQVPLTTTTHSLQVWADQSSPCAVTFTRTGGVEYSTDYADARKHPFTEAVRVGCDDLEKAENAATRDLSMKNVDTIKPSILDKDYGIDPLDGKLRKTREDFKNGLANSLRIFDLKRITDIRFVPPPAPFKP